MDLFAASLHISYGPLGIRRRTWLVCGLCCARLGGRRLRWLVGGLCSTQGLSQQQQGALVRVVFRETNPPTHRSLSTGSGSRWRRIRV